MQQGAFDDLIPAQNVQGGNSGAASVASDPFGDLIPQAAANVPRASPPAPDSSSGMGFWNGLGRHIAANVGSALQNTDKNIALPLLEQTPYFGNILKTAESIPQISQGKNKVLNTDLYQGMGINKGILDDISQGSMEFLPYMYGAGGATKAISEIPAAAKFFSKFAANNPITARIGGEAAKNVIANDAMALNQGDPNNTGSNLLYGTAAGVAAPVAGYGLGALRQYGAEKLAQSAIPGLTKKATDYMRNLLDPNDYAGQLYDRFSSMFNNNKSAWGNVNQAAQNIDKSLTGQSPAAPVLQKSPASSIKYQEVPGPSTMTGKDFSSLPSSRVMSSEDPYTGQGNFTYPEEYSSPVTVNTPKGKISGAVSPSAQVAVGANDPYTGAQIMQNSINFNASPYHSYIDSFINKVQNLEPAQRQEYTQALSLANKAKELAPQSFSGTVSGRKNINQDLKDFLNQQGNNANNSMNSQSKQFLTGLKSTLTSDIPQANAGNVGENAMNDFMGKWQEANKAHQDLQEFYRSPQPGSGVVKPVRQTREAFQAAQQGQPLDASIIGKYVPRPSQTGTGGLEQLATMMGSKEAAQDAVKSYLNRTPLTSGVSTLDVTNKYDSLSPMQREWIYGGSKEGELLEAANNARQAFGKEPARSLLKAAGHHAISFGVPAALGYFGSEMAGGDQRENVGAAAAALGLTGYGKFLARRFSPGQVNWLTNYAKGLPVNPGRYMNIAAQAGRYGGNNQ